MDYKLPQHKHLWCKSGDKPWTCQLCDFCTANLRHIENGYCFHDWSKKLHGLECCARCGVVINSRNVRQRCIGTIGLALRDGDIEDCADPRGKLIEACDRLLAVEHEVGEMPAEQRDWFFGKEGHRDCFLVARALKNLLLGEMVNTTV